MRHALRLAASRNRALKRLTHDKVPIHTLAKQMGTSVLMIEKHYSHLKVVQAINQFRSNESRQLIDAGGVTDDLYKSRKVKSAA